VDKTVVYHEFFLRLLAGTLVTVERACDQGPMNSIGATQLGRRDIELLEVPVGGVLNE